MEDQDAIYRTKINKAPGEDAIVEKVINYGNQNWNYQYLAESCNIGIYFPNR